MLILTTVNKRDEGVDNILTFRMETKLQRVANCETLHGVFIDMSLCHLPQGLIMQHAQKASSSKAAASEVTGGVPSGVR